MIKLTKHAKQQINERGITTIEEVQTKVDSFVKIIQSSNKPEVRIIIKKLNQWVSCGDGSNGSYVIACIDPKNLTVKTVMLVSPKQIYFNNQNHYYANRG